MILNPNTVSKHAVEHAVGGSDALTPAAIGAAKSVHTHTPSEAGAAPVVHTHTPSEAGAAPAVHTHTPDEVGSLPTTGGTLTGPLTVDTSTVNAVRVKRTTAGATFQSALSVGNYLSDGAVGLNLTNTDTGANAAQLYVTANKGIRYQPQGVSSFYEVLHTNNASSLVTDICTSLGYSKIITGTYSGAGKYGSSNPCTLTPGWAPKAMMIFPVTDSTTRAQFLAVFVKGQKGLVYCGENLGQGGGVSVFYELMNGTTWGSTNISWYSTNGANWQMNISGQSYGYIIWG